MFSSVYGVTHNNCRRSVLFAATDQPILSCVVSLHGLDESSTNFKTKTGHAGSGRIGRITGNRHVTGSMHSFTINKVNRRLSML